ncbi:MAG: glycosyltransferase family 39 protein [Saprospiraceae bacterium]|nr:glycosyltransferase family 39 protein [Saprospiraceae bacterium]
MAKKSPKSVASVASVQQQDFDISEFLKGKFFLWFSVGLISVFAIILRSRLLDIPFERDEGGFAYMGYSWIHGTPLFTDYVDVKPPIIYILYGIFAFLFGEDPSGIHTGLLLFNLFFAITFFWFLRKYYNGGIALLAAISFVLLSSTSNVFGFAAHATQLLVWPAIAGIWLSREAVDQGNMKKMALAGVFLGIAFLVKQQALGFMLLAGFMVSFVALYPKPRWIYWLKSGAILTFFAVLPYLVCLAWFGATGALHNFWYWTYVWPSQFAATQTGNMEIFTMMYNMVSRDIEGVWYLGLAGVILIWFSKMSVHEKVFPVLLTIFGFLSLSIGFHYYPHYFVVFLPAICLGFGLSMYTLGYWIHKIGISKNGAFGMVTILAMIPLFMAFSPLKNYYFSEKKQNILRRVYGTNPFQESYIMGTKIQKMSKPGDSILVLGSEPQILFYSKLPSVSEHMHYYQLVDGGSQNDSLQNVLIEKTEKSKPRIFSIQQGRVFMAQQKSG